MADTDGPRLLVFVAAGTRYGCGLEAVREIIPFRAATRLPGAPPYVVGLINLRGRLVTVSNLAVQLGQEHGRGLDTNARTTPATGSIVLLEVGARSVGMLVDEVRDVRFVGTTAIEPIERDQRTAGLMRALARFDDGVAVVLDAEAIIAQVLQ
jgi:purine-binding chemotaxis protein CheW